MAGVDEQHVRFLSAGQPGLLLEGVLATPIPMPSAMPAVALLCHPQPATSSADDPLTTQVARDLAASGFLALRFNFRGAGSSQGQPTDGRLEPLDIAGAVAFALSQPGTETARLVLIGHAFGACMVLAYAAHDPRVGLVVAISPPMMRLAPDLAAFAGQRIFVTGEHDEVAPRHKLEPWIAALRGPRSLKVVSGARHLMRGYESTASRSIVGAISVWAAQPTSGRV